MKIKIFVDNDAYRSFARAFSAYVNIFRTELSDLVEVTEDPEESTAVFLQGDITYVESTLAALPVLKNCYKIGFLVWETDDLPSQYLKIIESLDEIWTASWYCWNVFSKYHDNVHWVPHVTDDYALNSKDSITKIKKEIAHDPKFTYFFSIDGASPFRKNTKQAVQAFRYVHARYPDTRFVLKSDVEQGQSLGVRFERDGLIHYRGYLPREDIAAMYAIADIYVSAHHSEGWGFTLSDAMHHGVLCVGTGYSGNMDFMTPANSLLVCYIKSEIGQSPVGTPFSPEMKWASPFRESLEQQMLNAYRMRRSGEGRAVVEKAKQDIHWFGKKTIARMVRQRILALQKNGNCLFKGHGK